MVTVIPGSDLLTSALNVVSQSLQIPVIIFLLIFAVYSVITVGGLISEYSSRKKVPVKLIKDLIFSISREIVNFSNLFYHPFGCCPSGGGYSPLVSLL